MFSFKTADGLILRTFLAAFTFTFFLFAVLAFVMVLFDSMDTLIDHRTSFGVGLAYVLLSVPHHVVKAAPMIVVLAVVSGIGNLVRHNEMLMLFIAGYSPLRLAVPLAGILIAILSGLIVLNERVCGPFAAKADTLMAIRIKGTAQGLSSKKGIWMPGEGNRVFHATEYFPYSQRLTGVNIFEFKGPGNTISKRLDAESATYDAQAGGWILFNVVAHDILDDEIKREVFDTQPYWIDLLPRDFETVVQKPEQMTHGDLNRLIETIRNAGENPQVYLPDLRIKEAFPFAIFFLGMLAYAMTLRLGSSGVASGISLGLLAVIFYFMFLSLGKSFAQAGALPAWLGAWSPNVLCFILSIYLFHRMRLEI